MGAVALAERRRRPTTRPPAAEASEAPRTERAAPPAPATMPPEREGRSLGTVDAYPPTTAPQPAAPEPAATGATAAEAPQLEPATVPETVLAVDEAAAAEAAAARESADAAMAAATTATAKLEAYAAAPPTLKARRATTLDAEVAGAATAEATALQADVPDLHATLQGAEPPASAVPVVAPAARTVEVLDTQPGPAPEPEIPEPQVEGHFTPERDVTRVFAALFDPPPEQLAARIDDSLASVQTTDPSVPASAGTPPGIPLGGETDPARIAEADAAARGEAAAARDEATAAVIAGPGPERVQPVTIDESIAVGPLPVPPIVVPQAVAAAERDGPDAYLAMELPPEVQASFDAQQQAAMEQSMAAAVEHADAAVAERDTARQEAIAAAQEGTARLNEQADGQQRAAVLEARVGIQESRQATIDAQAREVERVGAEADARRRQDEEAIGTRVRDEQQQIDDAYAQADRDIGDEVAEGERKAREEREAAEREAADRSWWERAVDFVASAIDALVDAIGAVFDAVRSLVNGILDAVQALAMAVIDAAASFIKSAIEAFGELLKAAVTGLLGEVFPELAAALNAAIDDAVSVATAAVDAVADGLKSAVNALVEGLRAGLNALIGAFQAAITIALSIAQAAITGDWSALARRVLEAVLGVIGVTPEEFAAFVGRQQETFQIIVDDPGGFLSNVLASVSGGIQLFADNILAHLQAGIIGWLTGALGGAGIVLPERFDLMGVLDLVRQILGFTVERLRARAVRLIGEENVARLEVVLSFVATLVTEGWGALWDRIVDQLATLRDTVIDGIKDFLVERIVTVGITRLATMFNPVGAIVNLILTAWNIYTFLRDQLARLIEVVQTVTGAIGDIARGILDAAKATVEGILGRLLPLAIDLLARVIGLGNVSADVREIIERVQATVDRAIDALFERLARAFRGAGDGEAETPAVAGTDPETVPPEAAEGADTGAEEESLGVLLRAQEALGRRLGEPQTVGEVREDVDAVRSAVPGLAGMELRGPDDRGRYSAWAAASPWRLIGYVSYVDSPLARGDVSQRGTTLRVTLHVPDAAREYAEAEGIERRSDEGATIGSGRGIPESRTARPGGTIAAPRTGSERLELLTFNSPSGGVEGNSSHAEYRLLIFLGNNPAMATRVTQIDATSSYSPCRLCTGTLNRITTLTTGVTRNRRHLRWVDHWRRGNATTDASLRAIQGWQVVPATVPAVPEPAAEEGDGEGRREKSLAHWQPILEELHARHPEPGPAGGSRRRRR